jgi:hypothetical protein
VVRDALAPLTKSVAKISESTEEKNPAKTCICEA